MVEADPAATPTLTVLSLGAGIQSTTLALLAVEGALPKPDVAIFADTGWEPEPVYRHLRRLTEVCVSAGIPVEIVSKGNLRADALDPDKPIRLPAFVLNVDGTQGKQQRQCTEQYKLRPIRARIRELLGGDRVGDRPCASCDGSGQRVAPWRAKRDDHIVGVCSVCDGDGILDRVGPPPSGAFVDQWIGFSTDEISRVSSRAPRYIRNVYPLLDLGMSRTQCEAWLERRGWGDTPKSACIGCPFHGNAMWRKLRDHDPDSFADAVAFDSAFRHDPGLDGTLYLHRSMLPLDEAPIDRVERREYVQTDIFDAIALMEEGEPGGCSPYGCRADLQVGSP